MNNVFKIICAIAFLTVNQNASEAKQSKIRLENKAYGEARAIIYGYGWKSYEDLNYCSSNNKKDSCKNTPELYWCKFAMSCEISFFKEDKCLFLEVNGGPRWNSYHVNRVRFSQGIANCPQGN
jgi:hypothetical protein